MSSLESLDHHLVRCSVRKVLTLQVANTYCPFPSDRGKAMPGSNERDANAIRISRCSPLNLGMSVSQRGGVM